MLQGSCYHNVCPKTECEEILYGACTNSTVIDDEKNNISNNVWWLADDEFISDDKKNENKIFKILIQRLKELPKLGIVSCLASSDEAMDTKIFGLKHIKTAGQGGVPSSLQSTAIKGNRNRVAWSQVLNHCNVPLVYVAATIQGPALSRISPNLFQNLSYTQAALKAWDLGYHVAITICEPTTSALLRYEERKSQLPKDISDAWIIEKGGRPIHKPKLLSIRSKYENIQPIVQQLNARLITTTFFQQFPQAYAPKALHKFLARTGVKTTILPDMHKYNAIITKDQRATAVLMTYGTIARAIRAKNNIIHLMCNDYRYENYIAEIILIFNVVNSPTDSSFEPPPSNFFDEFQGKARLVIAKTNDLLNRYNMSLLQPLKTSLILLLDDDDTPPPAQEIAARIYVWWKLGGVGTVGIQGRSRIIYSELSFSQNCQSAYSISYTGHGPSGCSWFALPTGLLFSSQLAQAFFQPIHSQLHNFVRKHITHPDDFAFGAFAAWATGRPSIVIPPHTAQKIYNHLISYSRQPQAQLMDTNQTQHFFTNDEQNFHRRLGMAGSFNWHFNRAWAGFWIERYFDGGPSENDGPCRSLNSDDYLTGHIFGQNSSFLQLPNWRPSFKLV